MLVEFYKMDEGEWKEDKDSGVFDFNQWCRESVENKEGFTAEDFNRFENDLFEKGFAMIEIHCGYIKMVVVD